MPTYGGKPNPPNLRNYIKYDTNSPATSTPGTVTASATNPNAMQVDTHMQNVTQLRPGQIEKAQSQDFAMTLKQSQMKIRSIHPTNYSADGTNEYLPKSKIKFRLDETVAFERNGGMYCIKPSKAELYMDITPITSEALGWSDANQFVIHEAGAQSFIEKVAVLRNMAESTFLDKFNELASIFMMTILPLLPEYYNTLAILADMGFAHQEEKTYLTTNKYDNEEYARSNFFNQFIRASLYDGDSAYTNTFANSDPPMQMVGYQSFYYTKKPCYTMGPTFKIPLMPFEELWNQRTLGYMDVRTDDDQVALALEISLIAREDVIMASHLVNSSLSYKVFNPVIKMPSYYTNMIDKVPPTMEVNIFRSWMHETTYLNSTHTYHWAHTFSLSSAKALAIIFAFKLKAIDEPVSGDFTEKMDLTTEDKWDLHYDKNRKFRCPWSPRAFMNLKIGQQNWPYDDYMTATITDWKELTYEYFQIKQPRSLPSPVSNQLLQRNGVFAIILNGLTTGDQTSINPVDMSKGCTLEVVENRESNFVSFLNDYKCTMWVQYSGESRGNIVKGWSLDTLG